MYNTILWDVDGTLLHFLKSEEYAIIESFKKYGIFIDDEIVKAYSAINESYWKKLERREIEKIEVLRGRFITLFQELSPTGALAHKGLDVSLVQNIDVDEFRMVYQKLLGSVYFYQDDSLNVCKRLREKGYHQYIITNGVTWTQQNKLTLAGFYDVMDDVYISEQIGYNKPDKRFFEGCFDRMKENGFEIDLSKTLVVGDSQTSDMQGARNMGIDCCLYLGPINDAANSMPKDERCIMNMLKEQKVNHILYDLRKIEDILCQ